MPRLHPAMCVLLLLVTTHTRAGTPAPLFADSAPVEVVLTAPLGQLKDQKRQKERLYLPGQWAFKGADGNTVRLSVKVRARGNFRLATCDYAPIRLNFVKSEVKGTLFQGQDKLKLVSACKSADRYEQMVMLEYLAYLLHASLTEQAFLVRPLRIHFIDSDQRIKPRQGFAFLIEDEDEMAARNRSRIIKENSVTRNSLDNLAAARTEMFEYLIGNADYSVLMAREGDRCCHNTRLLVPEGGTALVPVPYDFDSSGLVDAPYATPPANLPIRTVRQRYFTGICKDDGMWQETARGFIDRRQALYDQLARLPDLEENYRRKTVDYLDDFFEILEDDKRFSRLIVDRCRG